MKSSMNKDAFADNPPPSGSNPKTPEPQLYQYGQNVELDEVMKTSKLFHGLQPQEIAEVVARLQPVYEEATGAAYLRKAPRPGKAFPSAIAACAFMSAVPRP